MAAAFGSRGSVVNPVNHLFTMNTCITGLMSHTKTKQWTGQLTAHHPPLSRRVMHQEFSLLHQTSTSFSLTYRQGRQAGIQIDRLADMSSHQKERDKDRWLVRQADQQAVLDSKTNWKIQKQGQQRQGWITRQSIHTCYFYHTNTHYIFIETCFRLHVKCLQAITLIIYSPKHLKAE